MKTTLPFVSGLYATQALGTNPQSAANIENSLLNTDSLYCVRDLSMIDLILSKELADKDGITEQFKAEYLMLWEQSMNSVRQTATKIVNHDLIYT